MRKLSFLVPASGSLVGLLALVAITSRTASDSGSWQRSLPSFSTCDPTEDWVWQQGQALCPPVVINLTDDNLNGVVDPYDVPEVAFISLVANNVGELVVVHGQNGNYYFTAGDNLLPCGVAAANIFGDPVAEVIAIEQPAPNMHRIVAFDASGTQVVTGQLTGALDGPTVHYTTISVADLNSDGVPEILVGEAVFGGSDGNLLWDGAVGRGEFQAGARSSTGADLDLDGNMEVLAGNTAYLWGGNIFWQFEATDGASAVGNYDDDNYPEVVFVSYNNKTIHLLDDVETSTPHDLHAFQYGAGTGDCVFPALGQFDNDPEPEVAETDGETLWGLDFSNGVWYIRWSLDVHDDSETKAGISLADLDLDGIDEVIYRDQSTLWIVDGETGSVEWQITTYPSETLVDYPVAADVDGDERMEVVVPANYRLSAIDCECWADGRRVWNDYTYHITNIDEDGTVPQNEAPNWLSYNNYLAQYAHGIVQSGDWIIEVVDPEVRGDYNALDLHLNRPWVSYYDEVNGHLKIGVKDDPFCNYPGWFLAPLDRGGGVKGRWTSVAIDTTWGNGIGIGHASYQHVTNGTVKYANFAECHPLLVPI